MFDNLFSSAPTKAVKKADTQFAGLFDNPKAKPTIAQAPITPVIPLKSQTSTPPILLDEGLSTNPYSLTNLVGGLKETVTHPILATKQVAKEIIPAVTETASKAKRELLGDNRPPLRAKIGEGLTPEQTRTAYKVVKKQETSQPEKGIEPLFSGLFPKGNEQQIDKIIALEDKGYSTEKAIQKAGMENLINLSGSVVTGMEYASPEELLASAKNAANKAKAAKLVKEEANITKKAMAYEGEIVGQKPSANKVPQETPQLPAGREPFRSSEPVVNIKPVNVTPNISNNLKVSENKPNIIKTANERELELNKQLKPLEDKLQANKKDWETKNPNQTGFTPNGDLGFLETKDREQYTKLNDELSRVQKEAARERVAIKKIENNVAENVSPKKLGFTKEYNDAFGGYDYFLSDKKTPIKEAQSKIIDLSKKYNFDLQANPDGTIRLYHGTTPEEANNIIKNGFNGDQLFASPSTDLEYGGVNGAGYYGDAILSFDVDPRELTFRKNGEYYASDGSNVKNIELVKNLVLKSEADSVKQATQARADRLKQEGFTPAIPDNNFPLKSQKDLFGGETKIEPQAEQQGLAFKPDKQALSSKLKTSVSSEKYIAGKTTQLLNAKSGQKDIESAIQGQDNLIEKAKKSKNIDDFISETAKEKNLTNVIRLVSDRELSLLNESGILPLSKTNELNAVSKSGFDYSKKLGAFGDKKNIIIFNDSVLSGLKPGDINKNYTIIDRPVNKSEIKEIITKAQLTDIWDKANQTIPSNTKKLQEIKKGVVITSPNGIVSNKVVDVFTNGAGTQSVTLENMNTGRRQTMPMSDALEIKEVIDKESQSIVHEDAPISKEASDYIDSELDWENNYAEEYGILAQKDIELTLKLKNNPSNKVIEKELADVNKQMVAAENNWLNKWGKEPVTPLGENTPVIKKLYRGSSGKVVGEEKNLGRVLTFDNNQLDVINDLAVKGNKEALDLLNNPANFYDKADKFLSKFYGDQYDTIEYQNNNRKMHGKEYHDLKTDTHWAESKDTAEAYSIQTRGIIDSLQGKKLTVEPGAFKDIPIILKSAKPKVDLEMGRLAMDGNPKALQQSKEDFIRNGAEYYKTLPEYNDLSIDDKKSSIENIQSDLSSYYDKLKSNNTFSQTALKSKPKAQSDILYSYWSFDMQSQYDNFKKTLNKYSNPKTREALTKDDSEAFRRILMDKGMTNKKVTQMLYTQDMPENELFIKFVDRFNQEKTGKPLMSNIDQQELNYIKESGLSDEIKQQIENIKKDAPKLKKIKEDKELDAIKELVQIQKKANDGTLTNNEALRYKHIIDAKKAKDSIEVEFSDQKMDEAFADTVLDYNKSGIKAFSKELKQTFFDWVNERSASKTAGYFKKKEFSDLDNLGLDGITEFQRGIRSGRYKDVEKFFDDKYQEVLDKTGLEFPYKHNYLPQMWDNTAAEIAKAMAEKDPQKRLTLKPSFTLQSLFKNYEEGIAVGLKPKFEHLSDLIGFYEGIANKSIADTKMFRKLAGNNLIVPDVKAPIGWKTLDPEHFPKIKTKFYSPEEGRMVTHSGTYKAPPDLANAINNYLTNPDTGALGQFAQFASKVKNLVLSSGIPQTGINAHGINILGRHTLISNNPIDGFLRGTYYMLNPAAGEQYLMKNAETAIEAVKAGLRMQSESTRVMDDELQNIAKKTLAKVIKFQEKNFEVPLFEKMLPALKLQTWNYIKNDLVRTGTSDAEAARIAAKIANNVYGGINLDELGRNKTTQQILRSFILAPDWAETNIRLGANIGKSFFNYKSPEYKFYRTMMRNLILGYVGINVINKIISGHWMFENQTGHQFQVEAGKSYDGKTRWVKPFGTAIDFVRIPFDITASLLKGDLSTVFKTVRNRLSIPAGVAFGLITNVDFTGRPIYGKDKYGNPLPVSQQVGGIANQLFDLGGPQYLQATVDLASGRSSWEQAIAQALEIPTAYSNKEQTAYYEQVDKAKAKKSEVKADFKPKYEAIKKMAQEGKGEESDKMINELSDADYKLFLTLYRADKAKETLKAKQSLLPIYQKIQAYVEAGDTEQADNMVNSLSDEDYKVLESLIKQLKQ